MTSASQTGHTLIFTFDALGRLRTESGPLGTIASEWDLAGRRTKLTWPDAFYVSYDYLLTGEMTRIRENGATSGIGVLATFGYDPQTVAGQLGLRTSLTRGNGTVTSYAYDPVSRLQQLRQDVEGAATANDLTLNFGYNPASQISLTARSNDLYAWTGHGSGTTGTTSNGRNQIANWVNTLGYDAKGNITGNGTYTFAYSSENLLTSLTNPVGTVQTSSTYAYDPLMRLAKIDSSNAALDADLGYDGQEIVLEGLSNNRTRRYVFGPGIDEPLVAYLVTSTGTSRSWYHADERGSTIRQTNDAGNPAGGIGRYDEYGVGPGTSRFQYTGQYWLGDGNLHYYRARIYDARLGRFLQPDPIGYGGGMNLYAYVTGDPVNFTDPLGLKGEDDDDKECGKVVREFCPIINGGRGSGTASGSGGAGFSGAPGVETFNPHAAFCSNADCTEATVTAATPEKPFILRDSRWIRNPHWVKSPWSQIFDYVTAGLFLGPVLVITGVEVLSWAALEAAIVRFAPSAKHLAGAGGRWAKFNTNSTLGVRRIVYQALRSPNRTITVQADGRYRVVADLGRTIGTNGQTSVRVIINQDGRIITAFPGM